MHYLTSTLTKAKRRTMSEKFFIKVTTDGAYGVESTLLNINEDLLEEAKGMLRIMAGTVNDLVAVQQIHITSDGVKHIKDVNLEHEKKVFLAIIKAMEIEPTDEQMETIKRKLEEIDHDSTDE